MVGAQAQWGHSLKVKRFPVATLILWNFKVIRKYRIKVTPIAIFIECDSC